MTKVSLSHQELTLSEVWQWYQKMDSAIDHYQTEVINALLSGKEVSDIFLGMTKEEIIEATLFLMERLKLVAEPSGATALAGLLFHRGRIPGKRIGVLVTGGNLDIRTKLKL